MQCDRESEDVLVKRKADGRPEPKKKLKESDHLIAFCTDALAEIRKVTKPEEAEELTPNPEPKPKPKEAEAEDGGGDVRGG